MHAKIYLQVEYVTKYMKLLMLAKNKWILVKYNQLLMHAKDKATGSKKCGFLQLNLNINSAS